MTVPTCSTKQREKLEEDTVNTFYCNCESHKGERPFHIDSGVQETSNHRAELINEVRLTH